jgi:ABC-type sugar transport system ATPase subunit
MTGILLAVSDIHKHFGGVAALRGASLEVRAGEVHALVGENGAGKSTLARIVAGIVRADSGRMAFAGHNTGVAMIPQELDLFPNLSVGENMIVGNSCFREGVWASTRRMAAFCQPFLDQVGLSCGVQLPAESLSLGQRQLLAIARALSMNARLLLMDEPTSSLFDDAVERLFGLIRGLRGPGVSVVYVSHKMDEIFRIANRITVLRDGQTVGTRETSATSPAEIIRMMVGRDLDLADRSGAPVHGDPVLQVAGLTTDRLRGISFTLHRGEVLGIAGLVGAGRSELGAALFGLERIRSGRVESSGGIGLVPEDRRLEGLMMNMSVRENASLAALDQLQTAGFLRLERERAAIQTAFRQVALDHTSADTCVSHLSGGNQQKVLLARWLLRDPDILFLDDPCRGIDVAAKHDIYRLIAELAAAGKAIILVSSELPELLRCSHRIMVLREGRVTALFPATEATQEKIMAAATMAEAHA